MCPGSGTADPDYVEARKIGPPVCPDQPWGRAAGRSNPRQCIELAGEAESGKPLGRNRSSLTTDRRLRVPMLTPTSTSRLSIRRGSAAERR